MSYDELIARLEAAVPEMKGKLKVDRVIYKRGSRHAYFYLLSDVVAGDKEYLAVQKILKAAFPGVRLSLRIASPMSNHRDVSPGFSIRRFPPGSLICATRRRTAASCWSCLTIFLCNT